MLDWLDWSKEMLIGWSYALSDLIVKNDATYKDFCIVERKSLRNLTTSFEEGRMKRSEVLTHLAKAGSVFRESEEQLKNSVIEKNDVAELIGYNCIVTFK